MTVYMLMYSLPEQAGGITSVMLNRSKILEEKGVSCRLLTLDDKDYSDLKKNLKKSGRLHKNVKIINIYEELENLNDISDKENDNKNKSLFEKLNQLNQEGYYIQKDQFNEKNYARYFKNSNYIMYKKWNKNELSHIDYFQNRKRVKRHIFKNKILRNEITYNEHNEISEKKYFSNDGFCYLTYWYGKDAKIVNIFYFDKSTKDVLNFKNNKEFHSYWLDQYLTSEDTLILDGIGTYPKVENMRNSAVKKVFTIHSNHFEYPYKYGAKIKPDFKRMLNNLSQLDVLVVLTEEQKKDIIKEFGDYNNIKVIPNAVYFDETFKVPTTKDNSIVILQRFVKMKNLEHIIKSMEIIRLKIKDVKLNLYGVGPQKQEYIELVKELNLENHVFINDYVFDLEDAYSKASLSVLTSDYEGLPMSILESMNHGVPVISYPINYGPESIIKNNIDGLITKSENDIQELADKIIYLLKKDRVRKKFSKNARINIKENFSYQAIFEKWDDIIKKNI